MVSHGAPYKSPRWDGISLKFYKTYWDVIEDDMLLLHKQMFEEVKITTAQEQVW
jgi:hypothetical protein